MDFAAWMEVYLGEPWFTFDPRNNDIRFGRILIAQGRDAADVPLTLIFGPGALSSFRVWTEEVQDATAPRKIEDNLFSHGASKTRGGGSAPHCRLLPS